MKDLSVIIVTWNSAGEIGECIESLINTSPGAEPELIIIDNNSADSTFDIINRIKFGDLHTYKNETNAGYTKAVNQGIRYSTGKNVLLLNPDTVLHEDALKILINFLNENSDYAAAAPLLLNTDGSVQYSLRNFPGYWEMFCEFSLLACIFPKSRLFGRWKMKYYDYSQDGDVSQPMAAALLVKKSVLDEVQNMDERFEMFFNDVDLCKKITDKGYKIRFINSAKITHGHGISIKKERIRMIKVWNRDCIRYFEKHYNNFILLLWLKVNLKISEILRIFYYKVFKA